MEKRNFAVLLIEQSGMMTHVIINLLHELGYQDVVRISDPKDAPDYLAQKSFGLIICDWYNSANSVLALLKQVRYNSKTHFIPFVIISGIIEYEVVEKAIALGVSEYIVKPFNANLLQEKISSAIKHPINQSPLNEELQQVDEFHSKVLLYLSHGLPQKEIQQQLSEVDCLVSHSVAETVTMMDKDVRIDILLLDEKTAMQNQQTLPQLLRRVKLGQIEIVFLTNNTSPGHIRALNQLGIVHIINTDTSLYDLGVRIGLLTQLKKALLHTSSAVRKAEMDNTDDSDVRNELAMSVMQKTGSIRKLTEHIEQGSQSNYITELSKEINHNTISIDSFTDAMRTVGNVAQWQKQASKEQLKLHNTTSCAEIIFADEIKEKQLHLLLDYPQEAAVMVNPTLFNSLIMFTLRAFIQDISFGGQLLLKATETEDGKDFQVDIEAKLPAIPKFKEITDYVRLVETGELKIKFKQTIQQLIQSQTSQFNYQFNVIDNQLTLCLVMPSAHPPKQEDDDTSLST